MSSTATHNLGSEASSIVSEKIQQILASVGSQKQDDSDKAEAAEYNWHQPHYFGSNQLKRLDGFVEKVAKSCTQKFTQLYHSDFNVAIVSTTQHFASELFNSDNEQSDYHLAFGNEEQVFGLVGIPGQTAIIWATQLLGDSKSAEDSDGDLSPLEQSLLFDIASGIIKALSDSYDGYDLRPLSEIVRGQMPIELDGTEEICKITFSVKKPDSENSSEAYFLIFCDKLQTIVGQKAQTGKVFSDQDISKAMHNHLQDTPVSVTVQLARVMFNFQEIMSLEVDDILLLDKRVNEPAELIVEGKAIFRGQPAKSESKHAVVITELCNTK